jgi:cupin 2 domain-containing protein
MSNAFKQAAYPVPIDHSAVETEWRGEGFSFGVFRDPPNQQWNDFVHRSDEYVLVAEGRLQIDVGEESAICEPGDLVLIPRGVSHSLQTLSPGGSV